MFRAGQYNEVALYSLGCRLRSFIWSRSVAKLANYAIELVGTLTRGRELSNGQAARPQIGRPYLVPSMLTATWGNPHLSADAARPPPPPSGMVSSHSYVTPTGAEPCCLLISGR